MLRVTVVYLLPLIHSLYKRNKERIRFIEFIWRHAQTTRGYKNIRIKSGNFLWRISLLFIHFERRWRRQDGKAARLLPGHQRRKTGHRMRSSKSPTDTNDADIGPRAGLRSRDEVLIGPPLSLFYHPVSVLSAPRFCEYFYTSHFLGKFSEAVGCKFFRHCLKGLRSFGKRPWIAVFLAQKLG